MRLTPRFSITNAIAAALTEIERARGFLDAASLSDEWIDSMRSRAFLLEAHHTTHIEGTRLTIEEAADLLACQGRRDIRPWGVDAQRLCPLKCQGKMSSR